MSKANLMSLNGLEVLQSLPFLSQLSAFGAIWVHESDRPGMIFVVDDCLGEIRMVECLRLGPDTSEGN